MMRAKTGRKWKKNRLFWKEGTVKPAVESRICIAILWNRMHCVRSGIFGSRVHRMLDQVTRILQTCGLEALCIPAITLYEEPDFACNALSLYAKLLLPERIYALAGLRRYLNREDNRDMLEQAKRLMAAGFDGLK